MSDHNGFSVLCPVAGLEQANRECGASWEGCNTRSASTSCGAPIPQCHTHHYIIRRDAWGRGTWSLIRSLDIFVLSPFHVTCIQSPVILKSNARELGTSLASRGITQDVNTCDEANFSCSLRFPS